MSVLSKTEVKALAKLLKASDDTTSQLIQEQLHKLSTDTLIEVNNEIPSDDTDLKKYFLETVKKIKRKQLLNDFDEWVKNSNPDLEEGVFLVGLFNQPFFNKNYYSKKLDGWAKELNSFLEKIKIKKDPTSVINEVNHFLFMELGFKGSKKNYYDPENSFIDKVIDKRTGNPILLSVIYLLLAKRTKLSFLGVNMPAHFIVQYIDGLEPVYVDPFNCGEIITKDVCKERVTTLRLPWQEDYLSNPTTKQIIARMIQNLINIYHNEGEFELKEYLESYARVLKKV